MSGDAAGRLRYIRGVIADVAGDDTISDYVKRQRLQELRKAEALAQRELDGAGIEAERYQRYLRKVAAEEEQKGEARQLEDQALKAMTPAEYDAWKRNVPISGQAPAPPKGRIIALQDLATEAAKAKAAEREAQEQKAGLPKAQAAHAARVQELRDERIAAEADADEAQQAARERELQALEALGPPPTLESLR
jgi:hypothetical protein